MKAEEVRSLLADVPAQEQLQVVLQGDAVDGDVLQIMDAGFANAVGHVIYVGLPEDEEAADQEPEDEEAADTEEEQ